MVGGSEDKRHLGSTGYKVFVRSFYGTKLLSICSLSAYNAHKGIAIKGPHVLGSYIFRTFLSWHLGSRSRASCLSNQIIAFNFTYPLMFQIQGIE